MAKARSEKKLAIEGGRPVRETLLPYGHQSIDEEDIQAVVAVLQSDWITTGPKVIEFEEAFGGPRRSKARRGLQLRNCCPAWCGLCSGP